MSRGGGASPYLDLCVTLSGPGQAKYKARRYHSMLYLELTLASRPNFL